MFILDTIGGTPLLKLGRIAPELAESGVSLFAKAEFFNPSGSVKYRATYNMIKDGIKTGKLTPGKTIIDATSGNSGIAYAMIGAALGYPVKLFMPKNTSAERKRIMKSFGAVIVETNPLESSDGAFLSARAEYERNPDIYFYPDQYNNPLNIEAHYKGTGVEIWEQTEKKVTHYVSVTGTSGTFTGTSKRLKDYNSSVKTYCVQPDSPFHGIEGTKHMETTIKPGIFDESIIDGTVHVATEDAFAMARDLAGKEGIFTGISAGANVHAAVRLARTLPAGSVVVTILCDSGSRYLSDSFWESA